MNLSEGNYILKFNSGDSIIVKSDGENIFSVSIDGIDDSVNQYPLSVNWENVLYADRLGEKKLAHFSELARRNSHIENFDSLIRLQQLVMTCRQLGIIRDAPNEHDVDQPSQKSESNCKIVTIPRPVKK